MNMFYHYLDLFTTVFIDDILIHQGAGKVRTVSSNCLTGFSDLYANTR